MQTDSRLPPFVVDKQIPWRPEAHFKWPTLWFSVLLELVNTSILAVIKVHDVETAKYGSLYIVTVTVLHVVYIFVFIFFFLGGGGAFN